MSRNEQTDPEGKRQYGNDGKQERYDAFCVFHVLPLSCFLWFKYILAYITMACKHFRVMCKHFCVFEV